MNVAFDEDALMASCELVRRAGASGLEFGFLEDDAATVAEGRWWAYAQFRGARIQVDEMPGPVEAVEALARRLLTGAKCRRCGEQIVLNDHAVGCRWTRVGKTWEAGCGKPIDHTIPVGPV